MPTVYRHSHRLDKGIAVPQRQRMSLPAGWSISAGRSTREDQIPGRSIAAVVPQNPRRVCRGYVAGLFYLYVCINRELLQANLGGDASLTAQALTALLHAITQASPTGMQNSFGSRAYASYLLAEKGEQQPRSLVQAFLKPIQPYGERDMLALAVEALTARCDNFDKVYGPCADNRYSFDVEKGTGSLGSAAAFVKG